MSAFTKRRAGRTATALAVASAMFLLDAPVQAAPPTGGSSATGRPARLGSPSSSAPTSSAPPSTSGAGPAGVELSGDEVILGPNSCKKWPPGKKFTITIPPEAELEQLVKWMMTISCQKFIWNAKIRSGKVTILSPEKVTLGEAYAAFYAAIESMGLTVEPAGSYFKIVETAEAKALPLYGAGRQSPNNDRVVTQLVRVNKAPVSDVEGVMTKLKSKAGDVQVVGNLIIYTDRGSVVRRVLKIVKEIDQGGTGEKIFFYQLQYADAEEVATIIRDIFGEGEKAAPKKKKKGKKAKAEVTESTFSRVIVDDRTGTLIIVAHESDYATILRLIKQLDVRLPGGGGRIRVRKLRNADPQEVATVLQNLAAGTGGGGGGDKKSKNKTATEGGASAELFSGEVKITADEATRSLVIVSSAADYKNLEAVIDQLDQERKQVYLEIYLMEATVGRQLTAGAGGHFGFPVDTAQGQGFGVVASSPTPEVNSLIVSPEALSGLAAGVFGPLVPGSGQFLGVGQDIPGFGVIIQALQTNDDVNVVAEPHMYTADNQEAQIEVGRRVPTPGALSFGGGAQGTSLTPLQSINREDVTLNIKVTPHVNDETTVTLDVELEDRDIVSIDPTLGVTTTKRRLKLDSILARNDQPVVLGGLIREREIENVNQVPGLGSIPLLGWLFKRKVKTKEKVNLLIVMVPHIIETPDDVRRIHERRYKERMEFLERETNFKKRALEPNVNYRKKAGLLATIDREARRLEHEELILRSAELELRGDSITGEIGGSLRPIEGSEEGEGDVGEAASKPAKPTRAGKTKPAKGGSG